MQQNEEFDNLDELKQNQLDDIVLEQQDRKERLKKYAILGAAFLLIFLAVIAMIKVLMESSFVPQDKIVDENVPVYEEPKESYEKVAVVEEPKKEIPTPAQPEPAEPQSEPAPLPVPEPLQSAPKAATIPQKTPSPEPKSATAPSPKTPPAKKVEPKEEPKIPEFPTIKKEAPAPQPPAKKSVAATGDYAIQVGAFLKKDPDPKFLKKIEDLGLRYTIKTFQKDGATIKRVYVGPYPTKEAALADLAKVRRELASTAFVTRLR